MNAKLCKLLRRQARANSVDLPERGLIVALGQKIPKDVFDRMGFVPTMANDPRTFRGIYRKLKNSARAAEIRRG